MSDTPKNNPTPGSQVVLTKLPPGFLDGLPQKDQEAIVDAVGTTVLLVEYDAHGRAELQFRSPQGIIHFIYVSPEFIKPA